MTEKFTPTNAASSGIDLDRNTLKTLCKRSDRPGLKFLAKWSLALLATGYLVYLSLDSWWVWPAMFIYGTVMGLPAYSMSHESAHGTAFRTRWLNEILFWVTSLIYFEEPLQPALHAHQSPYLHLACRQRQSDALRYASNAASVVYRNERLRYHLVSFTHFLSTRLRSIHQCYEVGYSKR